MTPMLEVKALSAGYASVVAVDQVSLQVAPGARHAIIGQNGAGKSTLINVIAGVLRPKSGRILLNGRDISGLPDHARARLGVAKTSQHANVFPTLSVLENVALAARRTVDSGSGIRDPRRRSRRFQRAAIDHLAAAGLFDRRHDRAGALSHSERRQLDLAMALAIGPRVLLLDEPTAGMSPPSTSQFITRMAALGPRVTIVIVEHDPELVFQVATHVTVLHQGRVLADGPPRFVRDDPAVQRAYLGDGVADSLFYDDRAGHAPVRPSAPIQRMGGQP
jgi:branched-chain amino acid transport system ATP-binding protein